MNAPAEAPRASSRVVEAQEISALFDVILASGYRLLGPTVKDGAIVYDEIPSAARLPVGVGQEQANGRYRLRPRGDDALFGYAVGPHAWKRFLSPPSRRIFRATRVKKSLRVEPETSDLCPDAFLGMRPCDLAAIGRQDRVFLGGPSRPGLRAAGVRRPSSSPPVRARRTAPASAPRWAPARGRMRASTSRSPSSSTAGAHEFLVEVGSERGAALLARSRPAPRPRSDREAAKVRRGAPRRMGRTLEPQGLQERSRRTWRARAGTSSRALPLLRELHARLPDLFCSTVEDTTDLTGGLRAVAALGLLLHARLLLHPRRERAAEAPRATGSG